MGRNGTTKAIPTIAIKREPKRVASAIFERIDCSGCSKLVRKRSPLCGGGNIELNEQTVEGYKLQNCITKYVKIWRTILGPSPHLTRANPWGLEVGVPYSSMAERVGFEPTIPKGIPLFENGALSHSATSP